ncbi:NACHT domain-containing protein [Solwaraspora sp. WMMD792]|uniref:NACHT domain-containing protein n=1 Tax=Solwaraspora sp. WMMD792 TaxID=3016099 RepID=UPI00241807D9|nr:NACHT domain-containing protein [Solwaraspora sp. WMMD792]MDG4769796.1 NACHT domain-containing protein [Solwaraspora sp. WMMD792]
MRTPSSGRLIAAGILALTALLLGGLAVILSRLGLERADQLASVVAMFIGVLAFGAAVIAVRQGRTVTSPVRTRRQRTAWGRRPLRDDVWRLLQDIEAAADRSPSRLLRNRRNEVSTVYVQQRVEQPQSAESRADDRRRRLSRFADERLFLPFDERPRVIPVRRPLEKVFDQHHHLLIEGGPGTGKSTTAAQICRQLARAWLHADEHGRRLSAKPLLPLLVTARSLAAHAGQKWPEALAAAASQGLGMAARDSVDPALLAGPVDGAEWLIVIDGLDEVPSDERETFMAVLSGWTAADDRPWRLLITTRPLAGHATAMLGAGTIGHYTLLPFDRRMLADFAHRWFGPSPEGADQATGFLSQVASAGLHEVAAVPLMATIAITVYADDPDSRLPRNRHDLYERYLHWLRQYNAARRASARTALTATLDGDSNNSELVAALCDRTDDLVEELAVVRVRSRRSLILTAMDWLRREAGPVSGRPPEDMAELVSEVLLSTGLLSFRDAGPDFIHLTFAEHFAARRFAAELPDRFDADDTGWRRALHRAVRDEPGAMAVLIRWTKFHPGDGDLLSWLLSGGAADRATAVRLVAEGAAASDRQLAACLDSLSDRLWRASPLGAVELVAPLRRFPVTPILVGWLARHVEIAEPGSAAWAALVALLADRDRSRRPALEAELLAQAGGGDSLAARLASVIALENIGSDQEAELARLLADTLTTAGGTISQRVAVASHLIDREGDPRDRALQVMRETLGDVAAQPSQRQVAAEALAEWDDASRQLILAELRFTLDKPDLNVSELTGVAETMLAVDRTCRAEIAGRCAYFLSERYIYDGERIQAARLLTELGPEYRPDGIRCLRHLSSADDVDPDIRIQAAVSLARVGEEHWPEVVEAICRALYDSGRSTRGFVPYWRLPGIERDLRDRIADAIEALTDESTLDTAEVSRIRASAVDLDPRFQPDADDVLRVAAGRSWTFKETTSLIALSSDCSLPVAAEFDRQLKRLVASPEVDLPDETVRATARYIRAYRPDPVVESLLHGLMVGSSTRVRARLDAALELIDHPTHSAAATKAIVDVHVPPSQRRWLFNAYSELVSRHASALEVLESYARNPHISPTWRVDVIPLLIKRAPQRAAEWLALLRDMLSERTNDLEDRRWIAMMLAENRAVADAAQVLEPAASDAYALDEERVNALAWLAQTETNGTGRYRAGLLSFFSDRHEPIEYRVQALQVLLRHGDDRHVPPLQLTDDLLWTNVPSVYDAQRTAELLYRSGWGRDTALEKAIGDLLLRSLARPYPLGGYVPPETGRRLDRIDGAMTAVRASLAAQPPTTTAVVTAAIALPEEESAAVAGIRRILDEPAATPEDRAQVLELQLDLSPAHRVPAVEVLHAALRRPDDGPVPPPIDPIDAARLLYQVVHSRAEAGAALATVAGDSKETWRRRREARAILAKEGGQRGLRHADLSFLTESGDDQLSLPDRCAALVRRADEVPGTLADTLDRLRSMLTAADSITTRTAVQLAIVTVDPEQDEPFTELLAMLTASDTPFGTVIEITQTLATGTPVQRLRAGLATEEILERSDITPVRRAALLALLAQMLPDTVHRVVTEVTGIAADPSLPPFVRIRAATILLGLGSGAAARPAHDVLHDLLDKPGTPGYLRVLAGQTLLDAPGPRRSETRARLLELDAAPDDRLAAAVAVLRTDGPEPAVRLCPREPSASMRMRELLALPGAKPYTILTAARALGGTGVWADRAAAATTMRQLADNPAAHPFVRFMALAAIPEMDFAEAGTCARRLLKVIIDDESPLDHRRWAAEALGKTARSHQRTARDALQTLDGDHLDPRARRRLHRSVASISNGSDWIPQQGGQS